MCIFCRHCLTYSLTGSIVNVFNKHQNTAIFASSLQISLHSTFYNSAWKDFLAPITYSQMHRVSSRTRTHSANTFGRFIKGWGFPRSTICTPCVTTLSLRCCTRELTARPSQTLQVTVIPRIWSRPTAIRRWS